MQENDEKRIERTVVWLDADIGLGDVVAETLKMDRLFLPTKRKLKFVQRTNKSGEIFTNLSLLHLIKILLII